MDTEKLDKMIADIHGTLSPDEHDYVLYGVNENNISKSLYEALELIKKLADAMEGQYCGGAFNEELGGMEIS